MDRIRLVLLASMLSAVATAGDLPASEPVTIDLTKWTPPDIASLGDDPFSNLVKYGHALFADTANEIGPTVSDPAKRFAGNNLTCESCHLQGGTQPYAMPLVGIWGQFPQYRAREGGVDTLEDRIDGCVERSMNGRHLPAESREMRAFTAYMRWLSTGIPDGAKLIGAGTLRIKEPIRAADPVRGLKVYGEICAACHGENGQGKRAQTGAGYELPPLWGPDSYNDGAGMNRLLTLAAYARNNMPYGTTFNAPLLTKEEAYDVAAYVASQERPARANLDRDYPIRLQKPVDAPYGPYADGFSLEQHKYGPFGPIRAKVKQLAAQSGTADAGRPDDGSAGTAQ
ncbi:MAG TPA: c-type cytochrome [Candidatus Udaeobacter sp.]|nr:c-type cytochrome [Candidatus Udaeobacter sp.]